jgi:FkbM family methyltransferase
MAAHTLPRCQARAGTRAFVVENMQAATLLSGAVNHLRRCRHGFVLYNCNDIYIGKSLEHYGEWSEGEIDLFRQVVRPGDIVVDAGAYIGTHALFLAQAVGPQAKVYAFEPQRLLFQMLCANMALNSITNVDCRQAALGAVRGSIKAPVFDVAAANNFGGFSLDWNQPGETVEVVPLDSLDLPSCSLMKIDVEGMELQVLQGATATIGRCQPCLYVENDRADQSLALTRFIDSLGYAMYWHLPPLYNPQNFYENRKNIFGNIISANLFCVPGHWNVDMQGFQRAYPGDKCPFDP